MSSTTQRPDAVVSSSGTVTPTGGTTTAVVGDNSDATYVAMNDATLVYSFTDFSFPAGAIIKSVTFRIKAQVANFTGGQYAFTAMLPYVGNTGPWLTPVNMSAQVFQCPTMTTRPDGSAWTADNVNALQLQIQNGGNTGWTGPDGWIYEVYMDVVYNVLPVVSGVSPNATVNTTRPTFGWTYSDTDGDLQERWRVRIYDSDQIAVAGFTPNPGDGMSAPAYNGPFIPLFDSGEQFGAQTTYTPPGDIANGKTVRAYVWVSDVGSNGRWTSNSVSGTYAHATIDLAPASQTQPAMPRIQATRDNTNQRWVITALDAQNLLGTDQADAETALAGWVAASASTTVTRDITAAGFHGLARYKIATTGSVNGSAVSASSGLGGGAPVLGNTVYSASAHFRAEAVARSCYMQISWYDAAGLTITTDSGPLVTNSTSTWIPAHITVISPSNAAYALVRVVVNGMLNGENQYFDTIQLVPGLLNMIANPIFETSAGTTTTGVGTIGNQWQATNNGAPSAQAYSIDTTVFKAGERSQKLVWSGGISTTQIGLSTNNFHPVVTSGVNYKVRAYVKSAQSTEFTMSATNMSGSVVQIVAEADGWTVLEYTGTATSSATSVLSITAKGVSGTVWFGYVQVSHELGGASSYTLSAPYLLWSGGGMNSVARFKVQRSLDAGLTWTDLIRLPWLQPTESGDPRVTNYQEADFNDVYQSMILYDYEVPKGETPIYRVRSIITFNNNAIASQWSIATQPFIPLDPVNPLMWWVKCPFAPWLNFQFDFEGPTWARTTTEEAAFFGPISRERSVRVSDVIRGSKFALTVFGTSWEIIDAITAIRAQQQPVLLQAPDGREWWVSFGPDEQVQELVLADRSDPTPPYQKLTYTFEEVDAPIY